MAVQLKRSKASEVISMTPLIDVVFLLLIFFLVASQFADEEENREGSPVENEIEVSLPSASDAVPLTAETNSMFVTVTKEGRFFLDGNSLTADQLETALQTAKQNNPLQTTVIMRGDKDVAYRHPVTVMDICKRLSIPLTTSTESE